MTYGVKVQSAGYNTTIYQFETKEEAEAFCREEVKWETTKSVYCPSLGIELQGDYSSFIKDAFQ